MATPTCPVCGAKFPGKEQCKHCGAPIHASAAAIAQLRVQGALKEQRKQIIGKRIPNRVIKGRAGSMQRKRRKHGRQS